MDYILTFILLLLIFGPIVPAIYYYIRQNDPSFRAGRFAKTLEAAGNLGGALLFIGIGLALLVALIQNAYNLHFLLLWPLGLLLEVPKLWYIIGAIGFLWWSWARAIRRREEAM